MYTIIRSSTEGFKNIKSKKYRLQFRCRIVKKKNSRQPNREKENLLGCGRKERGKREKQKDGGRDGMEKIIGITAGNPDIRNSGAATA